METTPNNPMAILSQLANQKLNNVKSYRETVNGKHVIQSAECKTSKKGHLMTEISFAYARDPELGISDFVRTGTVQDWDTSLNRIKYLADAVGISGDDIGACGVPFEPVLNESNNLVIVVNPTKESMTEVNAAYGTDILLWKIDDTTAYNTPDALQARGGVVAEKVCYVVRPNTEFATAYCTKIAELFSTAVGKTVDIDVSKSERNGFLNVSRYKAVK